MIKVLIIDDSQTAAYVCQQKLAKHAIQAEIATHLTEIVEASSKTDEFDCILLDVNMPVVDGEQLCNKLHSWGWEKGIIYYSSEPPERLAELVAASGNCYMQKDSDVTPLAERLLACPQKCDDCKFSGTLAMIA